jgi:diacylglycerol kinase family enzyme
VRETFFAIVNPAAGGGRSAKLAGPAIARLRGHGLHVDVIASTGPGHAADLAREAYDQGYRRFIAVGGDGTAHEILNGIFTHAGANARISLGFLPLGTGNSFLRDFAAQTAPKPRCKPCSKIASALSTCFALRTPKAKSTPSIC